MARVAIVSYNVQTIHGKAGGVGAFTTRWAELLRSNGDEVTIIVTRVDWEPVRVDAHWRARYQSLGIGLIELQAPPPSPTRWPEVPTMRIAELAAPVLKGFDVAYFQDWGNAAFHLVRERRYATAPGPVCVTVLHGPSEWELSSNQRFPELPKDLHLAYQERYAAQHSDAVVSPSRYMAQHLQGLGWSFPDEVEVLGLPMPEPESTAATLPAPHIRRIVYFGRIEERKGLRNFVLALQQIAAQLPPKIEIILLGGTDDHALLDFATRTLKDAGLAVSQQGSFDSAAALKFLAHSAHETLCVVPSPSDNHPYAVVEASLIPGLNLIACRSGGVPEILQDAESQLCDPLPRDLAAKILERVNAPLAATQLARYDCAAANHRWLAFHQRMVALAASRQPRALPQQRPTVDICITYFQKADYLGQLVDALEQQTQTDFHVIAVNDGSPDEYSNRVFDQHVGRTAERGWDFYWQPNAFVDAARNAAARRGTGDYILFIDADDVLPPHAVARMREAITLSGDDALICSSFLFAGDQRPVDPATGAVLVPPYATCIPLGIDLVGGIVNPQAFGGSMFIIRRGVFERIGGFRELRGAGHEDWELYVRLVLAGYKVDILPEFLQFYRQLEDSLAHTLPRDTARRRLLDAYEQHLQAAGLPGGALALAGLHQSAQLMEKRIRQLTTKVAAPQGRYAFFTGHTGTFDTEPDVVTRLQQWYREKLSFETRLKIHRVFLAPFIGPHEPPAP